MIWKRRSKERKTYFSYRMELERFIEAQLNCYTQALAEIQNGRKQSHWMWFIFPQLKGLGRSDTANYYGINNVDEAAAYLQHPVLGPRLIEISRAVLEVQGHTVADIFGYPDDLKLFSSMTLFSMADAADPVFEQVLTKYFKGSRDQMTLQRI